MLRDNAPQPPCQKQHAAALALGDDGHTIIWRVGRRVQPDEMAALGQRRSDEPHGSDSDYAVGWGPIFHHRAWASMAAIASPLHASADWPVASALAEQRQSVIQPISFTFARRSAFAAEP